MMRYKRHEELEPPMCVCYKIKERVIDHPTKPIETDLYNSTCNFSVHADLVTSSFNFSVKLSAEKHTIELNRN